MSTLLADDNGEIRAALRLLLEELGERDIIESADLRQTRAALNQAHVDVVLLDWELPNGDYSGSDGQGEERAQAAFVQELKSRVPDCRVIAMSGAIEARQESLRAGCDAFISRNEPPDRLLALLGVGRGPAGSHIAQDRP